MCTYNQEIWEMKQMVKFGFVHLSFLIVIRNLY